MSELHIVCKCSCGEVVNVSCRREKILHEDESTATKKHRLAGIYSNLAAAVSKLIRVIFPY